MSIAQLREYHPLFLVTMFGLLLSYSAFIMMIGLIPISYFSGTKIHFAIGPLTFPWLFISAFVFRILMSIIWHIAGKPIRRKTDS